MAHETGKRATTYVGVISVREDQTDAQKYIDFCTDYSQPNNPRKCSKFCQGKQDITPRLPPCDGTANSSIWCCGEATDCCQPGDRVITLEQVLGRLSSSGASPLPTTTAISTAGSSSSPDVQNPRTLSAGAIGGAGNACSWQILKSKSIKQEADCQGPTDVS
jgi:hypothetical protein